MMCTASSTPRMSRQSRCRTLETENTAQNAKLSKKFSTAIRQNSSIHDTLLCIRCMLSKITVADPDFELRRKEAARFFTTKKLFSKKQIKAQQPSL